jgi:hypothetical protein
VLARCAQRFLRRYAADHNTIYLQRHLITILRTFRGFSPLADSVSETQ